MQAQSSVPRGTLLILSGAAALALCYFGYRNYSIYQAKPQVGTQLHRSNAVRRRRRRWRPGMEVIELDYDPIARALTHLEQREAAGIGYGMYHNRHYVHDELLASHGQSFVLLPSKLRHIYQTIAQAHNLSHGLRGELMKHIQVQFVQNFLKEEIPDGYILNGDANELVTELPTILHPSLVKTVIHLRDQGAEPEPADKWLGEEPEQEIEGDLQGPIEIAQALSGRGAGAARESSPSANWAEHEEEQGEGHVVLDLLYRIAEENAKWSGYRHRGVQCNGCGMQPIRGIRYHCANCWDYDLCETCENQQIHHKTHVFYKIRIPAPTRGQIKLVQPKWYPGSPNACPASIPNALMQSLLHTTGLERQDLDALYDQFKCIAGKPWPDDPDQIRMAIDRTSFDRYFTSTTADRPPTPNLIYDRIFDFYDSDTDGRISFAEFAKGTAELTNNTTRDARIRRLFKAFDLDSDGYVSRRDFLHMLNAHYNLNKELAHEMVYAREDVHLTDEDTHEVIRGNGPISAAFGGNHFAAHLSRHGESKHIDSFGDLIFDDELDEILMEDTLMTGNRRDSIARQAGETRVLLQNRRQLDGQGIRDEPVMSTFGMPPTPTFRDEDSIMASPRSNDAGVDRLGHIDDGWPTSHLVPSDVQDALGGNVALEDVMDPIDRRRVLTAQRDRLFLQLEESNSEVEQAAVNDRWHRRQFYNDTDEGFTKPAGYYESDSSDEEIAPRMNGAGKKIPSKSGSCPLSLRSRSSSKVRFDDSAVDNDNESKSDISSRNTPVNERWGGFELSRPDRDVGVELIYEAVQEAFNDMLDHFFREKEDKAMDARQTRKQRKQYAAQIKQYAEALQDDAQRQETPLYQADLTRFEALLGSRSVPDTVRSTQTTASLDISNQAGSLGGFNEVSNSNSNVSSTRIQGTNIPDPTLPQNRPDDPPTPRLPKPDFELKIDKSLLAMWHGHNLVDAEAQDRCGYGRINMKEFRQKLRDAQPDIDISSEGQDEDFWEAKADLGKFSFLSTWIEMASF